jgi:uncharacterized protein YbjQ (UPF0145 family)
MSATRHWLWLIVAALSPVGLSGCAGPVKYSVTPTAAIQADRALPEADLLDVGIQVFDTAAITAAEAREQNTDPKILEAEARFVPFHLKKTLQETGQWGAVRVLPERAEEVDVSVSGKLLESNGEKLRVEVKVVDATGREWFHNEYTAQATEKSYEALDKKQDRDPYQDLYNQVANDMLAYRQQLKASDVSAIRQVAQLKFARSVVPYAFDGYLVQDRDKIIKVSRLPAENDPMFERVNRIRDREYMFIDTVNIYYGNLYDDMRQPYGQWRRSYLQELNKKRELERQVWERRALGAAAIIGAAFIGSNSNSGGSAAARNILIIGGYEIIRSSGQLANDARVHEAALKELGVSFKGDVAPVLDEVEGRTLKLSGSVDAQYAQWRRTLQELFAAETGLTPVTATTTPGTSPEPEKSR